jgi:phosphoglycerate dehydrogenase-like enzyme
MNEWLRRALQERRIRGAALDVFEVEPLPSSSALWGLPNALLSPHCADRTADFQADAMRFFASNAQRYLEGQPLLNIVDKARLRGWFAWFACAVCRGGWAFRTADASRAQEKGY